MRRTHKDSSARLTNGPLHSIHLSVFQLNSALSPSPVARGGLAFTSRISLFMFGELSRTLRTDALGHSKCWPQRLWIGGSVVPPKRGVCVCVFLWAAGGLVSWDCLLACAPCACVQNIHVRPQSMCVHLCVRLCFGCIKLGGDGGSGQSTVRKKKGGMFWVLQVGFQGCGMMH